MELNHKLLVAIFGGLGDAISFMVLLSPVPTFHQIYKKKSTEGFQALPYIIALFMSMLWIYYAILKTHETFIFIINTFGIVIESIYITIFLLYASDSKTRLSTIKMLMLLNVFGYGALLLSTFYLAKGEKRLAIVGWVCLAANISVFASPLCSLRRVFKTKSVEFMPFNLAFFLTLNAVAWFFYGLLIHDKVVCLPNTLGFVFGIIQMLVYVIYRKNTKVILEEPLKLQELNGGHVIVDAAKLATLPPSSDPNHRNQVVVTVANAKQDTYPNSST